MVKDQVKTQFKTVIGKVKEQVESHMLTVSSSLQKRVETLVQERMTRLTTEVRQKMHKFKLQSTGLAKSASHLSIVDQQL